jgi:putative spermidine/putrescine transport system substrate-binding protein
MFNLGANPMKKLLILSTALTVVAYSAQADITVMSWGGAYGEAQTEAFIKPFIAATGKATIMVDSDGRSGQRHC